MLTKITETTYGNRYSSKASAYSLDNASSDNTFVKSILGNNYNEVDLTANAVVNISENTDEALSSASVYSSSYRTETLYTIGSDEIGNITNIGDVTLDWNGRRLKSISQDGLELVSYDYNIDGQRTKKTALDLETGEPVTTEYFYNGSILSGQKTGEDVLIFMYDNNGDIFGFTYNGTPYYYVKNAQNDVFLILDENGRAVVVYQYDAWGKVIGCFDVTDCNIASINPIMYRSYYVDLEMGMFIYYLNSRYYIADWGRFASADGYVQTGQGMLDKNMFSYCANNPVMFCDPSGCAYEITIKATGNSGWYEIHKEITDANDYNVTYKNGTYVCTTVKAPQLTSKQKKDQLSLAKTIIGEAGGRIRYSDTWELGQEAVLWTIINRYNSSGFPNDWTAVVSAPNQYLGYYAQVDADEISWDYAMEISKYAVLGQYEMIPYPLGFTDKHYYFRTDEGQTFDAWDGIVRYGGNVFFYYK